ncbi:MAG: hypothetical protein ACLUD2_18155 [Clostridium sp.]
MYYVKAVPKVGRWRVTDVKLQRINNPVRGRHDSGEQKTTRSAGKGGRHTAAVPQRTVAESWANTMRI